MLAALKYKDQPDLLDQYENPRMCSVKSPYIKVDITKTHGNTEWANHQHQNGSGFKNDAGKINDTTGERGEYLLYLYYYFQNLYVMSVNCACAIPFSVGSAVMHANRNMSSKALKWFLWGFS